MILKTFQNNHLTGKHRAVTQAQTTKLIAAHLWKYRNFPTFSLNWIQRVGFKEMIAKTTSYKLYN